MHTVGMWEINLRAHTAQTGGFVVKFTAQPMGSYCDTDCCRDMEGVVWWGKVSPESHAIRNETMRLRMLQEAADVYQRVIRKTIPPTRI
ncbi:MAG: hypothetical protein IPP88_11665 [Betaproteobacteria bacterium]|nr:hypothetical protein [Betaproteobacteria bacterium]